MPIPAALLARLKKRGIVKSDASEPEQPEEEVIAEDYDDNPQDNSTQNRSGPCSGCPNKWNIYHECTAYCYTWKQGKVQESPNTKRRRLKMLAKYPLPDNWAEIYDPGTGRHYYWKQGTDDVSWMPPSHPKAKVSAPADKLRELIKDTDDGIDMDSGSDDDMDADEAEVQTSTERSRSRQLNARDRTRIIVAATAEGTTITEPEKLEGGSAKRTTWTQWTLHPTQMFHVEPGLLDWRKAMKPRQEPTPQLVALCTRCGLIPAPVLFCV
uniref:WW domain-containing protein n=1 Tax=Ornithodoros erraticus TaxID=265619 RepID=A0A293LUK5_ORNER